MRLARRSSRTCVLLCTPGLGSVGRVSSAWFQSRRAWSSRAAARGRQRALVPAGARWQHWGLHWRRRHPDCGGAILLCAAVAVTATAAAAAAAAATVTIAVGVAGKQS